MIPQSSPNTLTKQRYGQSVNYYDFSSSTKLRKKAVALGLLIGDCIGSTSEFMDPRDVGTLIDPRNKTGWPYRMVSNHLWEEGESTDDGDVSF